MSFLTDTLKSGANMLAGSVSEKLGVDPTLAQGLVEKIAPSQTAATDEAQAGIIDQQAQPAATDEAQAEITDQEAQPGEVDELAEAAPEAEQAEAAPEVDAEPQGLLGKATALVGGSAAIAATAKQFLDQDDDGNPLNDITNLASRFLGKQQNA